MKTSLPQEYVCALTAYFSNPVIQGYTLSQSEYEQAVKLIDECIEKVKVHLRGDIHE